MKYLDAPPIGIYEKAMPKGRDWPVKLTTARDAGYSFVEMSVDETDERLARLDWTRDQRKDLINAVLETGVPIPSMCLSGHRRFPLGSENRDERETALGIMRKAIELAVDLGIRNIQLAGYDVYYTSGNAETRKNFLEGLKQAVAWASKSQVMLSMEIMDHPLMNSISRFLEYADKIPSPWFTVYPDVGNLSAWGNDVESELTKGFHKIVAVHLKDTKAVSGVFGGQFKEVPFGEGCVDFPHLFSVLNRLGYKGPFVIEMWTEKAADPIAEIRKAREWMLKQMKRGGYSPH